MEDETNETESRFQHLLQPIRDLAENWNIDIAHELEEYLSDLETISFSFEDGKRLNFAEAALLIQGSACIYSKKVEYLYQLVLNALDLLAEKKKARAQTSSIVDGVDKDVEEEEEIEFLALDDIAEAEGIDLVENKSSQLDNDNFRLSNASNLALLVSRQSIEEQAGIGMKRSDFRMNTAVLHKSGALLLEEKDSQDLDDKLHRIRSSTPSANLLRRLSGQILTPATSEHPQAQSQQDDIVFDGVDAGGFHSDDEDTHAGFEPVQEPEQQQEQQRKSRRGRRQSNQNDESDPVYWKLLDPHEPGNVKQKPFKKGKTYKIPSLKEEPEKAPEKTDDNTVRTLSLKGSYWPEFDYLYERIVKQRRVDRRKYKEDILAKSFVNIPNVSVAAIAAQALIEEAEEEEGHVAFDFVANNDDDMDEPPAPIAMDLPDEHSSSNIQSYEDICRSHVEQYLATAQAFVQESALGQKVNEWAKKIAPVLEEQESRPSFDIHHYGDKLMTRFGEEGKRISVEELMGEQEDPMFEVCRNFVAVLQLANFQNVEIIPRSKQINDVEFKLLTTKPAYDIESYRAPSVLGNTRQEAEPRHEEEEEDLNNNNNHMDVEDDEVPLVRKNKQKSKKKTKDANKENLVNYNKRASREISVV